MSDNDDENKEATDATIEYAVELLQRQGGIVINNKTHYLILMDRLYLKKVLDQSDHKHVMIMVKKPEFQD